MVVKPWKALLLALGLGVSGVALATVAENKTEPCDTSLSTFELQACTQQAYEAADVRLNEVYRTALAGLGDRETEMLREAQRAWVRFRDTECSFQRALWQGGTGAGYAEFECLRQLTLRRAEDLQRVVDR